MKANILGLFVATALLTAHAATAQDVSVGYQFQHLSAEPLGMNMPLGFAFDAGIPLRHGVSIVGAMDWSRRAESVTAPNSAIAVVTATAVHYTTFAGGLRWADTAERSLKPFVHALLGGTHMSWGSTVNEQSVSSGADTRPMVNLGGGVAVPMRKNVAAVAGLDYRRIFVEAVGVNSVRIALGFRFALR